MTYDRDQLLERTDLRALADDLLGLPKGRGPSATWPCPDPSHGPQTGHTPPVSIFVDRTGTQRWHCHGCGVGGTAIDLVASAHGMSVRDAFEFLASRTGLGPIAQWRPPSPRLRVRPPPLPELEPGPDALVEYVEACEQTLWSADGARQRAWLAERRIPEAVLEENRVGADPGPHRLARGDGLPRRGPAVVLPILTPAGEPAYLQARYLQPDRAGRKYDNPAEAVAPLPRVAPVTTPWCGPRPAVLVVCEGIPDALVVAGTGIHAVAVLGAGLPNAAIADRLVRHAGDTPIVVAFDADPRGRAGAQRLERELQRVRPGSTHVLDLERGDLNDWAQRAGDDFAPQLHETLSVTAGLDLEPSPGLSRSL